jgi:uncharacterized protein YjbI with pentapeptide repeats
VDWRGADLRGVRLFQVDLRQAALTRADLRWATLSSVDLRGADLRDADLRGAALQLANLANADFRGADLRGALLTEVTGIEALGGADLRGALVDGRLLLIAQHHPARRLADPTTDATDLA